ncbi:MAG: ATP-binding cassette domain-containing protein [Oscillospiraceae bacterium]|nr:ATP-binding cassette domain-containing protein [Oscillospiraceae bacterium]
MKKSKERISVLDEAVSRLSAVNSSKSKKSWDEACNEDEKVCRVLCDYLRIEPHMPSSDTHDKFTSLTDEILYMSGLRHKDVSLPQDWWRHGNGAMLGRLTDGTPIALLPGRLRGYRVYNPRSRGIRKVDAQMAANIIPQATAVFRTFSSNKKIGLKDIVGFILGENIYKEIAIIALCSFLASIIAMIPAVVSEQIFDVIVPGNMRVLMIEVVFILIAFQLADAGFSIMVNLGVARIHTKGGLAVQAALWDRLLSLKVPFFNRYTTGELISKIGSIERVKDMVSMEALQVVFTNLFAFVYIIALFTFVAQITPAVLAMFVILFAVHIVAGMKKYKLFKQYTDLENKEMSFNHQCTKGMQRIKVSCAEERIFNIWSTFESQRRMIRNKINNISNGVNAFQIFFDFASTAVVYFLIAGAEGVGVGAFIAYLSAFLIFQKSMRKLLKALGILPELISVCTNVKPILDEAPEYDSRKIIPKDMGGTLEVNHLDFRYEQFGKNVLSDVSFRIEDGESVGILGMSGGGKTTLIKVLMGLYDLTGGKIYYGGYDLETIDLRYLRKQVGVVLQNGRPTVGDVYSNVTNNDNTISAQAVMQALQKVGLDEMVKALPSGLYTKLESCALSEGEKQRLLIARAIVKEYKFIIFDEATKSLDNVSRAMIMKNLREIKATKIIIAQQESVVEYCDRVFVLENGRIAKREDSA